MRRVILNATVAIACIFALGSTTFAQPSSEPMALDFAEALAIDAKIYAELYQVNFDEAVRRLSVMASTNENVVEEAASQGADFGGAYYDNVTSDFGVVVRRKGQSRTDKTVIRRGNAELRARSKADREARRAERRALRAKFSVADAEVESAETILAQDTTYKIRFRGGAAKSLKELSDALAENGEQVRKIRGFQTSYIDQKSGEIVLLVVKGDVEAARTAVSSLFKVPVRIDEVPGKFVDVALRGGQFTIEQSRQYCMTSFAVKRNSDNKLGVMTAGHCQSANPISIKDTDAKTYALTQSDAFDNSADYDQMFLSGTPSAVAEFYFDNSGTARSVTGTRSRASTTAGNGTLTTASTVPGTFVCHLGQKTLGSGIKAQSCGEVLSTFAHRGAGTTYNGSYVLVRNTQSGAGTVRTSGTGTLICFEGDSGGPFFANTTAYGVASACLWAGGSTSSPADGSTLYIMYSSVDFFATKGFTILVK